ncbi:MAG: hypothetical protein P4N60_24520 [Verrucomicrobiae bacterium]|nr:hypothetical protein [Verrucomicrobiae bacterium]
MDTTPPKRHGCLTVLLIFMLVVNSLTMATYLFAGQRIMAAFPKAPSWLPYVLAVGCALNVFFTVSIFRWQKWAFYAFCVVAGVCFFVNIAIGVPLISAILGLLGPAVLYGVLQIGKEDRGWFHLK